MRPAEEVYEVAKSLPEVAAAEVLDFARFLRDKIEQRTGDAAYDQWFRREVERGQSDARAGHLIAAADVDQESGREEAHLLGGPDSRG